MALPSSGAISSSMIATELGLSISNLSLDRMGVSASLSLASSSISMSQFYGYSDQDDYKLYYYYNIGQKSDDFACGNNTNAAFYFSGSGTAPASSDFLFTAANPSSANPLNLTGGQWYGIASSLGALPTSAMSISLADNNQVAFVSLCFL